MRIAAARHQSLGSDGDDWPDKVSRSRDAAAMAAGVSALTAVFPSRPLCAATAFTILQTDGLDSSLPPLCANNLAEYPSKHELDDADRDEDGDKEEQEEEEEEDSATSRTTAIRRSACAAEVWELSRLDKQLQRASLERIRASDRVQSKSQGNLRELERDQQCATGARQRLHLSAEDFNELLSAKLRGVQRRAEEERRRLAAEASYAYHPRPFVSTVRSGEFLAPPPELAQLLGLQLPETADQAPGTTSDLHGSHPRACFRQQLRRALRPAHETRSVLPSLCVPDNSRQTDHPPPFGNLMFDRRIVRGSTFAAPPLLVHGEQSQVSRQAEARKRQLIRKRCQLQTAKAMLVRIGTPPPMLGRKHEPVQTELFLEELFEKPDEIEIGVQTDYFLDRPATPPSCHPKRGLDASTQIEPGDLFDYDVEVQPILEVLVGKTIEQALIEVLEEEEIATLRKQQRKFLELRAAEKAEQERLEEQDRRLRDEKHRRIRQHEKALKTQQETEERVAAAVLLTGYIAELLPAVLEGLKISGFLLEEIKADVEEDFMPWLMKEVKKEMGTVVESREILEDIIKEIIENRAEIYRQFGEDYDVSQKSKVDNLEEFCKMEEEIVSKHSTSDHTN